MISAITKATKALSQKGKGFISTYMSRKQSVTDGSWGRNSRLQGRNVEANTETQSVEESFLLACLYDLIDWHSYTTLNHPCPGVVLPFQRTDISHIDNKSSKHTTHLHRQSVSLLRHSILCEVAKTQPRQMPA